MKIITHPSITVLNILNRFKRSDTSNRLSKYCVQLSTVNGVLLLHQLTKELLFLSHEEYNNLFDIEYLRKNWFLVDEDTNEKECADFIKLFLTLQTKKSKTITGYTIFTTTDCNARCFYCFELGRSRIPMSTDVAFKTLQFIKEHCGGKKVKLSWFGGEPLMNTEVIDIISEGLHESGIEYVSRMTSNGYLFNDFIVEKAINSWNLKRVQITLDGTESTYNKIKAFIYKEGNPYQIVLQNIDRLLNTSIHVIIRLNMDLHNAEDLLLLAQEFSARFAERPNLEVYAYHLFEEGVPMSQMHTDEEWAKREEAMKKIEVVLDQAGLSSKSGITKKFKLFHCMADSGSAVTILPDGNIGLCEHHTESEFIGHLDLDGFDQSVIDSWKERMPEIPECADCFYYPQCIKLKKCSTSRECYPQYRSSIYRKIQRQMLNEYERWKKGVSTTDDENDDLI